MRRSEAGDARASLVAASADPDWLTQYYVATGLARLVDSSGGEERAGIVAAATRALDIVQGARPDMPHALMLRADIALRSDGDLAAALQNIRRARALAPGREDYAFLEAQILAWQGAFAAARDVLGPLMSPGARPETREPARTTMAVVVAMERQAAARAARAEVPDLAPAEPVYRIMRNGEQRTEGLLERIECGARVITVHLRADGRLLRFTGSRLNDLEFIAYRDDQSGTVTCGPRVPPDRVYVTWKPTTGVPASIVGRAVAIEFLPK